MTNLTTEQIQQLQATIEQQQQLIASQQEQLNNKLSITAFETSKGLIIKLEHSDKDETSHFLYKQTSSKGKTYYKGTRKEMIFKENSQEETTIKEEETTKTPPRPKRK